MKKILTIFAMASLFASISIAASVQQVKGKRTLINLDTTMANTGDEFFTVDAAGKRRAIIKIRQIKGGRATADVLRGRPQVGHTLTPRTAPSASAKRSTPTQKKSSSSKSATSSQPGWGAMASVFMNSMSAKFIASGNRQVSVDMKGNSFGATGLYDYRLSPNFSIRAIAGYEQYQLSGSTPLSDCEASTTCVVNIDYLSGYGIARYNFTLDPSRIWVGGGIGLLYAMSKASNVLNTSQITSNMMYVAAAGADIKMGAQSFLPIQVDYGMFQGSDSVKASSIVLRAGWGYYF